jgi:hypothetical protein
VFHTEGAHTPARRISSSGPSAGSGSASGPGATVLVATAAGPGAGASLWRTTRAGLASRGRG